MAHRRARLTVFGRQLLVARIAAGHPAARVAEQLGISRATAYKTLINEWAYGRPYVSNEERAAALPTFVDFYNQRRPHTALGGLSPSAVVNNVRGDHT